MAHFAKVVDGVVAEVLVVGNDQEDRGQEFLANDLNLGGTWKKTSYNTHGGVHSDGGTPLHKNYAGIGYTWDGVGFAAPKSYNSWTLNSDTYLWEPPVPMPTDGKMYIWNESTTSWNEVTE